MNNVTDAITAIGKCTTNDELRAIMEAIQLKRQYISRQTIRQIRVGDTVEFDRGPRRGGMIRGVVTKINVKNVKVQTSAGIWNVSATLLKTVETV